MIPALERFRDVLADKAKQWDKIIKIGRTHLADATPLRLGQEFGGFARQLQLSIERAQHSAMKAVLELPAGGTAVGTGINTHPEFGRRVAASAGQGNGQSPSSKPPTTSKPTPSATAWSNAAASCAPSPSRCSTSPTTSAGSSSGPRCGFYEIKLPDLQPGSSIMPGKVNPVMCESMMQVCARVIGNDQTVAFSGATGGQFQLNIMMPVMGLAALESVTLLASATKAFVDFCAVEMEANPEACEASVEKSLSMVTSLNPHIGYERAAALAKEAFKTGKTIRELCREQKMLPDDVLNKALDPWRMTEPQK